MDNNTGPDTFEAELRTVVWKAKHQRNLSPERVREALRKEWDRSITTQFGDEIAAFSGTPKEGG